jgi:radical SAM protein with 4Fe4S-binding SPASM domain
LNNGESSSPIVLKNIERLKEAKIPFSINTVFDYSKTKSMKKLVDYVCQQSVGQYGFSASFTINDDTYIDEIIDQIKLVILRLKENKFDIRNKFRFYNEIIGRPGRTCHAGVGIFALGTNLEVWPCQSMVNKKPLGYFDENLKFLLKTSEDNKYFYNRTLLPKCTDCSVLNWCRGGCRAVHLTDKKAVDITCRIKQEILPFILKETQNYSHRNCSHTKNDKLNTIFDTYITEQLKEQAASARSMFVETPPLPED